MKRVSERRSTNSVRFWVCMLWRKVEQQMNLTYTSLIPRITWE